MFAPKLRGPRLRGYRPTEDEDDEPPTLRPLWELILVAAVPGVVAIARDHVARKHAMEHPELYDQTGDE